MRASNYDCLVEMSLNHQSLIISDITSNIRQYPAHQFEEWLKSKPQDWYIVSPKIQYISLYFYGDVIYLHTVSKQRSEKNQF